MGVKLEQAAEQEPWIEHNGRMSLGKTRPNLEGCGAKEMKE